MTPEESAQHIRDMLRARGLLEGRALPTSAAAEVWSVFKQFAQMPVEGLSREDDSDGLLFQTGVYDWDDGRGRNFNFSLVRQFAFDDEDGEYDHMEQLEVLLLFQPVSQLEELPSGDLWSLGKSLGEYFREVEVLPNFQGIIQSGLSPTHLLVQLEEV